MSIFSRFWGLKPALFALILTYCVWARLLIAQERDLTPEESEFAKPIAKAIAYLAAETPKWQVEHRCASCHHQGSGVRALLAARGKGLLKSDEPLETSLAWLERPATWAENHGDPQASDQALAEIQFGGSLFMAEKQFSERFKEPLKTVAKQLAARQAANGRFDLEASGGLASPITLGPILLTGLARDAMASQGERYAKEVRRANEWLEKASPRNPFEAASLLLVLPKGEGSRGKARELLVGSADRDGGFGPYASAPAEVFDTALAILALSRDEEAKTNRDFLEKAKRRLVKWQAADGSFEETTRPSGGVSYAHRVSTTAWALEALLEGL